MPINCPLALPGLCDGCGKYNPDNKTCTFHFPPTPISEILTPDERIDRLEGIIEGFQQWVPSHVLADIRKDLNQTKGLVLHVQNHLNEHIQMAKGKNKKRNIKSKGVVEV